MLLYNDVHYNTFMYTGNKADYFKQNLSDITVLKLIFPKIVTSSFTFKHLTSRNDCTPVCLRSSALSFH